jgi:hypothetical protein
MNSVSERRRARGARAGDHERGADITPGGDIDDVIGNRSAAPLRSRRHRMPHWDCLDWL